MRAETVHKGRVWALSAALLAGLVYSVFALGVNTKVAYASSCNCSEELAEGQAFCASVGATIHAWACPYNSSQGPAWLVQCSNGLEIGELCSGT